MYGSSKDNNLRSNTFLLQGHIDSKLRPEPLTKNFDNLRGHHNYAFCFLPRSMGVERKLLKIAFSYI